MAKKDDYKVFKLLPRAGEFPLLLKRDYAMACSYIDSGGVLATSDARVLRHDDRVVILVTASREHSDSPVRGYHYWLQYATRHRSWVSKNRNFHLVREAWDSAVTLVGLASLGWGLS